MSNISFGQCLKYLLSALDLSMSRLSKAINVDNSLVNRWINEKRIPACDTRYIENIAEFLEKNIYNSYQINSINELYLSYHNSQDTLSMVDKIKKMLYEAQGYSLEKNKKTKKENASTQNIYTPVEINTNFVFEGSESPVTERIVQGTENILLTSLDFLEYTLSYNNIKDNVLYITYNNYDINGIAKDIAKKIYDYLYKLIEKGWKVIFIIKLDTNINRIISLVDYSLPLSKTGKVNFFYYYKHDLFTTEREIFIATDVASLTCFPSKPNSLVDWAFYLKNPISVAIYSNYIKAILKSHTKEIANYYNSTMQNKYTEFITQVIEYDNMQYSYNYGLNMVLIPMHLYERFLKRLRLPDEAIHITLLHLDRMYTGTINNLKKNKYYNISYASHINEMVENHKSTVFTHLGNYVVDLEYDEIVECINYIADFINKYENYQLAVLHHNLDDFSELSKCIYVIKERKAVLLNLFESSTENNFTKLSITEPTIVKAFEEHFTSLWEKISPIDKDKNEITNWLTSRLK